MDEYAVNANYNSVVLSNNNKSRLVDKVQGVCLKTRPGTVMDTGIRNSINDLRLPVDADLVEMDDQLGSETLKIEKSRDDETIVMAENQRIKERLANWQSTRI